MGEWEPAGSGVSQIIAGTDVTISPVGGTGAVTISVTTPGGNFILNPTAVKTANYNLAADDLVPANASGGSFTLTLPTAPPDKTLAAVIATVAPGANTVTIATGGTDVINAPGVTSDVVRIGGEAKVYQYDAANATWYRFSNTPVNALLAYIMTAANIEVTFGAKGQIYLGTGAGTGTLLAIGSTGQVLTVAGGTLVYSTPTPASSGLSVTQLLASNAAWPIPAGATMLEVTCVGGGGGGGGSAGGGTAQIGAAGGGGGAGQAIVGIMAVGGATTLAVVIGAGGTGGIAGTINQGAGAGNGNGSGISSVTNATTTQVIQAVGGSPGGGGATGTSAGGIAGGYGSNGQINTSNPSIGSGTSGGGSNTTANRAGGAVSYSGGGGGGGGGANGGTANGTGGLAGSLGGEGGNGGAGGGGGTQAGGSAAANSGAGGGGAGGSMTIAVTGSVGAAGGNGGSGLVIIKVVG